MTALRFASLLTVLGLALGAPSALAEEGGRTVLESPSTATEGDSAGFAADRPGFGDATSVVPPWHVAIETGMTLSSAAADSTFGYQGVLVRMGLLSWLELRMQEGGVTHAFGADAAAHDPGGAGFKVAFGLLDGLALSLVTMFGTPSVDAAPGEETFRFASGLNVELGLSDTAAVALTAVADVTEERWEAGGAVGLIANLDDASLYVEGVVLTDDSAETSLQFGIGATRMLTDSLQVDLFMDYALPASGTTVLIGLGLAILI